MWELFSGEHFCVCKDEIHVVEFLSEPSFSRHTISDWIFKMECQLFSSRQKPPLPLLMPLMEDALFLCRYKILDIIYIFVNLTIVYRSCFFAWNSHNEYFTYLDMKYLFLK